MLIVFWIVGVIVWFIVLFILFSLRDNLCSQRKDIPPFLEIPFTAMIIPTVLIVGTIVGLSVLISDSIKKIRGISYLA